MAVIGPLQSSDKQGLCQIIAPGRVMQAQSQGSSQDKEAASIASTACRADLKAITRQQQQQQQCCRACCKAGLPWQFSQSVSWIMGP